MKIKLIFLFRCLEFEYQANWKGGVREEKGAEGREDGWGGELKEEKT